MKRNILIILTITIGAVVLFGCKSRKPGDTSGIVTFKLGSAQIHTEGGRQVELQVKDPVLPGDTIVTGEKSTAVVQFAENCVVRVDESSTITVKAISENNRDLFVRKGQVLAKLIRTGNNNATIATPTAVAGVRGTQFSVNFRDGSTKVAVTEGKVAVSAVRSDEKGTPAEQPKEEKLTEAGSTAEITAQPKTAEGKEAPLALNVRPISETEKTELKKIESVPVIPEAEKKTPEAIESTVKKATTGEDETKETSAEARQEKLKALMEKKTRSIEEIREVFNRIDEITLYNGRVIQGAVISRGERYTILTPGGTVSIPEKEIKGSRILK
jgi:hypothetical protein